MKDINQSPWLDVFKAKIVNCAKFSQFFEFPLVKSVSYEPSKAIPFKDARNSKSFDCWLHFYLHDYRFECVWKTPEKYLPLFKKFQGVITPDYSLYWNLPLAMQIWNTYRNRAIGYWLQNNGVPIITNVRWGDERTYSFAFEGLEKGGTYAIGSNGCVKNKTNRYFFQKGLEKMTGALLPDTIVNYGYYSKDIFEKYEKYGIKIITLAHWSEAIKRRRPNGRG